MRLRQIFWARKLRDVSFSNIKFQGWWENIRKVTNYLCSTPLDFTNLMVFLMWLNKWFWENQFSSVGDDKNTCVNKLMLHYTSRGFSIIWKKCEGGKRADLTHGDVNERRGRGPSQGGCQVGVTFFKIIYCLFNNYNMLLQRENLNCR